MVCRFSDFRCKEVIHVCEGARLGYVNDLVLEQDTGQICSIVVPGPAKFLGLFGREDDYVIPWRCIRRIGEDIILVDGPIESWRVARKKRGIFL